MEGKRREDEGERKGGEWGGDNKEREHIDSVYINYLCTYHALVARDK